MSKDTNKDVQKAAEEAIPQEQNWKDVMLKLGKAHDDLAKTSLSATEYRPISRLLTEVKVWLFHYFNSVSGTQWKGEEALKKEIERLKDLLYDQFYRRLSDASIIEKDIIKSWKIFTKENNL